MHIHIITYIYAALLLIFSISNHAKKNTQDYTVLKKIAYHYLYGQVRLHAKQFQLDIHKPTSRVKLKACKTEQLTPFLPAHQKLLSTRSIGIRCPEHDWVTYLPVKLTVYAQVIVAREQIPRNTLIRRDQLELKTISYRELRSNYYQKFDYLIGRNTKYPIKSGSIISEYSLKKEYMVQRGEHVQIRAQINNIKATSLGVALQNALRGQQVEVKNIQSQKIIKGKATDKGVVDVIY
ncbi:flagellar basal body P-ring biosynthesis protein FlgA [Piscirickettsia salmonis]|uniref:flagellar basal body P-ring formation chaperone FlgA n=1 Tax=Piscirickettsia salmonis TaxID=1238 RepID=UPI0012BB1191|nr:flagellar basal body P-ring formation chaperone FlgA [Piscirickettsia salmonis]QGP53975.1 flagellar basal body P-ring biosynthesis protein FlgA [Piscirickettsia salmonis]QGP60128.1 flagellar basal body P-ring biosynthesis protein FlgA [Piscirickettsia salmonis]QGP63551.1 flagellar basal body P-ring biosynthesis protein FlgA [Piscirickettsia salmonis]